MRAVVEDMLSGKPEGFKPTFEQGIKLRSFFRELGDTDGLPNSQQAAFKQMSAAADSAMESTANKIGATQNWRDANAGWKDYTSRYGDPQSPFYRILRQQDPAKITRSILNNGSAHDIELLKNQGMDAAVEPIKRQVIQDIAQNKFTVGRDGLGGYSDSFLNTLFGPAGKKELYLKADIARRIGWDANPSRTSDVMLGAEQLGNASKMAQFAGAAKVSMPRNPTSYLPGKSTYGQRIPLSGLMNLRNSSDEEQ
jgi:hypothetical protein